MEKMSSAKKRSLKKRRRETSKFSDGMPNRNERVTKIQRDTEKLRSKRGQPRKKANREHLYENNSQGPIHNKHRNKQLHKNRQRPKKRIQTTPAKRVGKLWFTLIGNILFYTITLGIIAMALMFSFSSKSSASIFGYRFYTVLTNSMVPQKDSPKGGFYAGDIVIVQLMDGNKAQEGDIVTFSVGDGTRYLTHRVVEKRDELNGETGQFLVTKGDANETNDPPIEADRVEGKVVVALPKVGLILDFIREEFWACLISILSFYGFILVLRAYLFAPNEDLKKRKIEKRPQGMRH